MSRLFLLRHARAAWAEPGDRDFDRPLTEAGRRESLAVGAIMQANGHRPDRVVCSPARRALDTWRGVAEILDMKPGEALLSETLYAADAGGYLNIVRNNGANGSLLLVGHNPAIEDLAIGLSAACVGRARADLDKGFPTGGLAILSFADDLSEAMLGTATLEAFFVPTDR
ncbi:histidine phosphatase family protein [Aquibium carbonis]|uniref:Histidine phosphatase family protein n=1 Tax=Aquibium carbonis TaxID=2495581 RepID=A0A3S0AV96_9HYPH|nr:histidine phosphatase family protein [Aquibium carbonis]RST87959.1 histidine phosphatase family protein [Aquibium carbonis]